LGVADRLPLKQLPPLINKILKDNKKIKRHLGTDYLKALKDYDLVFKTAGIPFKIVQPYLKKSQKVTSQTEVFFGQCPGIIIGVTGTKGKSTTCSLIYHILKKAGFKAHLIGNIEKPALDWLARARPDDIFVYELSSHQLFKLKKSPRIAVLLNIYPEHLDYYRSFKEYLKAKANITKHQTRNDYLVYDPKDPLIAKIALNSKARKLPIDVAKTDRMTRQIKIPLRGDFYLKNIGAALEAVAILGVNQKTAIKALTSFKPLEHRLEFVGKFGGIEFYNDSLATIPQATIGAVETMASRLATIILGGFDRGVSFKQLAKKVWQSKIKTIILFPESGNRIWQEILEARPKHKKLPRTFMVQNMKDAVRLAYQHTRRGKLCLLSPASPSFGLFKDYKERGNLFKKHVKSFGKRVKA
jgi:UDP-N-acetylmuramoylalanine--D-glutamate ligase